MNYACFGTRLFAHIIDNVIGIVIVALAVGVFLAFTAISPLGVFIGFLLGAVIFAGGLFLNEAYLVNKKGASLGKMAAGIRIVDAKKKNISMGRALGRLLIKDAFFLFSLLGALVYSLPICGSDKKQSVGDMIVGSYVVYAR
jgi:uncharacterized RDD family membrane protein YckC